MDRARAERDETAQTTAAPQRHEPPTVRRSIRGIRVGAVDDPAEAEADRLADRVVAGLGLTAHRHPAGSTSGVAMASGGELADADARLLRSAGPGRPLDPAARSRVQPLIRRDLSGVRVHTGAAADTVARNIDARAFTLGADIYFRRGEHSPDTTEGMHTLAHELGHVAQQSPTAHRLTIHRLKGTSSVSKPKKKKQQKGASGADSVGPIPRGWPLHLARDLKGYACDPATGAVESTARRIPVRTGTKLTAAGVGATVKGKPAKHFVVCQDDQGAGVALVHSELTSSKSWTRHISAGAGHASWLAKGTGSLGDAGMSITKDVKSAKAEELAKGVTSDRLTKVARGELASEEQEVYDLANFGSKEYSAAFGTVDTVGALASSIVSGAALISKWNTMSPAERADAVADNFGQFARMFTSVAGTADAFHQLGNDATINFGMTSVTYAADGELATGVADKKVTEVGRVATGAGMFTSGIDALLSLKDAIKKFVTWCKHLNKPDKHGNLVAEGVGTLKSFGAAAKSAMDVAYTVREFFTGAAATAGALPGIGLALDAISICQRGLAIYRARRDVKSVSASKKAHKQQLSTWLNTSDKVDHRKIRTERVKLERLRAEAEEQLASEKRPAARANLEQRLRQMNERLELIGDYELDRDLKNTANKRRNRAILGIVVDGQSLVSNVLTLAGQAHAATTFKVSGALTSVGALAVRKIKQFARDHHWAGTNANKTTKKKNARYAEIAATLYDQFIDAHLRAIGTYPPLAEATSSVDFDRRVNDARYKLIHDRAALELEAAEAKLRGTTYHRPSVQLFHQLQPALDARERVKGRMKAAGLSWREFCAENDPLKRFQMLIAQQKVRE